MLSYVIISVSMKTVTLGLKSPQYKLILMIEFVIVIVNQMVVYSNKHLSFFLTKRYVESKGR